MIPRRVKVSDKQQDLLPKYPKGFDISLTEVMMKFNFKDESLKRFQEMHQKRSPLAYAIVGGQYYYRLSQLQDLFKEEVV